MAERTPNPKRLSSGEALGEKLLQSVREMKAAQAARVTNIEPNDVIHEKVQADSDV